MVYLLLNTVARTWGMNQILIGGGMQVVRLNTKQITCDHTPTGFALRIGTCY